MKMNPPFDPSKALKGAPAFRRASTSSCRRSSTSSMNQSATSLCLLDLEETLDDEHMPHHEKKKYVEHSQIFDDMVATTAVEYEAPEPVLRRQESCRMQEGFRKKTPKAVRRHSSFQSRQAKKSYAHHIKLKGFLNSFRDQDRSTYVKDLLEFNLSMDMASMSDLSMMDKSPGLHYSCPVLSYMNDDEEDSVELTTFRQQTRKRASMAVFKEEPAEESWESLNDCDDTREYEIKIKMDDSEDEPRIKKRRTPSCQVLSQRLREEGPQQILRSLGAI